MIGRRTTSRWSQRRSAKQRQKQADAIAALPALSPTDEAETYGRDRHWYSRYIAPFYLPWMSDPRSNEAQRLLPELRDLAAELSREDIEVMLASHWRLQVMGAWYAVIADDSALRDPLMASLNACGGDLTASALCAAVVTYADDTTVDALRAYRNRADLIHGYSALDEATAAIAHLGGPNDGHALDPRAAAELGSLLAVAEALRTPGAR